SPPPTEHATGRKRPVYDRRARIGGTKSGALIGCSPTVTIVMMAVVTKVVVMVVVGMVVVVMVVVGMIVVVVLIAISTMIIINILNVGPGYRLLRRRRRERKRRSGSRSRGEHGRTSERGQGSPCQNMRQHFVLLRCQFDLERYPNGLNRLGRRLFRS